MSARLFYVTPKILLSKIDRVKIFNLLAVDEGNQSEKDWKQKTLELDYKYFNNKSSPSIQMLLIMYL